MRMIQEIIYYIQACERKRKKGASRKEKEKNSKSLVYGHPLYSDSVTILPFPGPSCVFNCLIEKHRPKLNSKHQLVYIKKSY